MDRIENESTLSLRTEGDIRAFGLEEVSGSAGNELLRQTFPLFLIELNTQPSELIEIWDKTHAAQVWNKVVWVMELQ